MTNMTRRALLSATGAAAAASLAGCSTSTFNGDDSPMETTDADQTSTTTDSNPELSPTTGDERDERTTGDNSHAGILSIINETDARREFTVTIINDRTGEEQRFYRTVAAGKQKEIRGVYPIVDDGIVVHSTTIKSNGAVVGEHDVRVFDYHKVHDVTATVTETGVEWTTTIH